MGSLDIYIHIHNFAGARAPDGTGGTHVWTAAPTRRGARYLPTSPAAETSLRVLVARGACSAAGSEAAAWGGRHRQRARR
jgi:hypothetical protein